MVSPTLADLKNAFYGGGSIAEYNALLAYQNAGIISSDVLAAAQGVKNTNFEPFSGFEASLLDSGEETLPRNYLNGGGFAFGTSGDMRFAYITARRTEDITQFTIGSGTAAGATPTVVRFGVYSEAVNGDLALLAAIANDTSIFSAANTGYTRTLTSIFHKVKGTRYALGLLIVSAASMPNINGTSNSFAGVDEILSPRLTARITGQADLPANVAAGTLTASGTCPYMRLTP